MNARQFKKNFNKIKFYGLKDCEYIVAEIDPNVIKPYQASLITMRIKDVVGSDKFLGTIKGIDLKSINKKQLIFMRDQINNVLGEEK